MEKIVQEALHYLGADHNAPDTLIHAVSAAVSHLQSTVKPRFTYRRFSIAPTPDGFFLPEVNLLLTGKTVKTMLVQCDAAVLMACTLGTGFDTLLRASQARDMAQAVILDACASALVEAGCDAAEQEISARFPEFFLTDRFSPGYGDLLLEIQPSICTILDTPRRLGLHVTESCLLNPGKSVTAVIGLSDKPQMARIRGCDYCILREHCALRKGGNRCGL